MGQIKFDEQLAVVEKYYSRLIYYELNGNRENLLGDKKSQRKCRFCGNEEQESFIKKAHAIPSSIGNNVLKTAYECDDCNSYFCKMESHFSNFMALYHVFSHVSRGKKEPEYRNNSKSRIVANSEGIDIYLAKEDENLSVILDREGKTITVEGVRSYIPVYVYKIFVKMGLSIMPEVEMHFFKSTIEWLMNDNIFVPDLYLSIRMYQALDSFNGACMIYKRKQEIINNVPCYLFGLTYNNFFFQIRIPLCDQDISLKGKVRIPSIPCRWDKEGIGYNKFWLNLSSHTKKAKEKVTLRFDVGNWVV
jgi:hypothetical protein